MDKRIVIAGSRNYNNYQEAKEFIDFHIENIKKEFNLIFLSGGCKGADMLGERYAIEHGFQIERFPAEWKKYGRAAGPKRNEQMAKSADLVICFWDKKSSGTKSMIQYTKKYNKSIYIKEITLNDI